MQGYQITFFTQQSRKHHGKPLGEWLVELARELQLPGATLIAGHTGLGHHHRIHSTHFFELADQPLEVLMIVGDNDANRLFCRLESEGVEVFYVKAPVEFGTLGKEAT
jgi:PII-like signaling protein